MTELRAGGAHPEALAVGRTEPGVSIQPRVGFMAVGQAVGASTACP